MRVATNVSCQGVCCMHEETTQQPSERCGLDLTEFVACIEEQPNNCPTGVGLPLPHLLHGELIHLTQAVSAQNTCTNVKLKCHQRLITSMVHCYTYSPQITPTSTQ